MSTILGTKHNDTLAALQELDQVFGLAGNDKLSTNFSDVLLSGGAGKDTLEAAVTGYENEYSEVVASTFLDGGDGKDTLASSAIISTDTADPNKFYVTSNILDGGGGNDTLRSVSEINIQTDPGQPDQFAQSRVSDFLAGRDGDDDLVAVSNVITDGRGDIDLQLIGEAGADKVEATATMTGTGSDRVGAFVAGDGGDGNDVVSVSLAVNSLGGGNGVGTVYGIGGSGNDDVSGVCSAKSAAGGGLGLTLMGGSGNDQLNGVCTVETATDGDISADMHGGAGSDNITESLILDTAGFGSIYNSVTGDDPFIKGGNDVITLDIQMNAASGSMTLYIADYDGDDSMSVSVQTNALLESSTLNLYSGSGDDFVEGTLVAPPTDQAYWEISGGDGNDRLIANGGNNNYIYGNAGSDDVTGSNQTDFFGFSVGELTDGHQDKDIITNYSKNSGDVIALPDGINSVSSFEVRGSDTWLTLVGDHDQIILQGVTVADLATDILFA